MAHAGKAYPVDQRARIYAGYGQWPLFPAKAYELYIGHCHGTTGDLVPNDSHCTVVIDDTSLYLPILVYRGTLGTFGGKVLELGWLFATVGTETDWYYNFECWLDGVPQTIGPRPGFAALACQQFAEFLVDTDFVDPSDFWISLGMGMQAHVW